MNYQNLNDAYRFIENYNENNVIIDKEMTGTGISHDFIGISPDWEQGEAEMIDKYFDPNICQRVLEIGAGSGKVSHYINRKMNDRSKHYAVEPLEAEMGKRVGALIHQNRKKMGDKYFIDHRKIEDIPTKDIVNKLGGPPTCIISDCEGCTLNYYQNNPEIFNSVKMIMNEMDGHTNKLRNLWKSNGFTQKVIGCGCGSNCCDTDMWVKE